MGGSAEDERRPRRDVDSRAGHGDLGQPLLTRRRAGTELEEQLFACPHDSEVCAATIKTPDKSKTSGVIVKTVVLTPAGVTGPALGITLQ